MTEKEKNQLLKEKIDKADAIVVGTASGMSAASGLRFYYQDNDDYKKMAGGLREKYGVYNMFDAYYDPRLTKEEHWALLLRSIKHLYEVETGETYKDLYEILEGKNYYIVTTNQDAQLFRLFPAGRITRLQGDSRYFQCKNCCHDAIYCNKEMVYDLIDKIDGDSLPKHYIPKCPECSGVMADWVRSREFLQGKEYEQEYERYMSFLRKHMKKKVLFLELGVGMMTPMFIKEPFMNMVYQWPDAFYATVNPKHAIIPKEIASKSMGIQDDIAFVLKDMLGKPTGHLKRENKDIFDSGKIY